MGPPFPNIGILLWDSAINRSPRDNPIRLIYFIAAIYFQVSEPLKKAPRVTDSWSSPLPAFHTLWWCLRLRLNINYSGLGVILPKHSTRTWTKKKYKSGLNYTYVDDANTALQICHCRECSGTMFFQSGLEARNRLIGPPYRKKYLW